MAAKKIRIQLKKPNGDLLYPKVMSNDVTVEIANDTSGLQRPSNPTLTDEIIALRGFAKDRKENEDDIYQKIGDISSLRAKLVEGVADSDKNLVDVINKIYDNAANVDTSDIVENHLMTVNSEGKLVDTGKTVDDFLEYNILV